MTEFVRHATALARATSLDPAAGSSQVEMPSTPAVRLYGTHAPCVCLYPRRLMPFCLPPDMSDPTLAGAAESSSMHGGGVDEKRFAKLVHHVTLCGRGLTLQAVHRRTTYRPFWSRCARVRSDLCDGRPGGCTHFPPLHNPRRTAARATARRSWHSRIHTQFCCGSRLPKAMCAQTKRPATTSVRLDKHVLEGRHNL